MLFYNIVNKILLAQLVININFFKWINECQTVLLLWMNQKVLCIPLHTLILEPKRDSSPNLLILDIQQSHPHPTRGRPTASGAGVLCNMHPNQPKGTSSHKVVNCGVSVRRLCLKGPCTFSSRKFTFWVLRPSSPKEFRLQAWPPLSYETLSYNKLLIQAHSQGVQNTPPNLPKGLRLATKWTKNEVFLSYQ